MELATTDYYLESLGGLLTDPDGPTLSVDLQRMFIEWTKALGTSVDQPLEDVLDPDPRFF